MTDAPAVILASASAARRAMLEAAGVPLAGALPALVDEETLKLSLKAEQAPAEAAAETLAELKAVKISRGHPGALVIGGDQILTLNGEWFDKPPDRDHAAAHLRTLRGKTHELVSAVVLAQDGRRIWHHVDRARLTMRPVTDAFIDAYLDAAGVAALSSVGAYQLEGLGAQLFSRVEGDFFTVLGLPLLPLLDMLRNHGVLKQ